MTIVPKRDPELGDPPGEGSSVTPPAPHLRPLAGRIEPGEDVEVDDPPMVVETAGPQEATRRVIAGGVVAGYSILTGMGLAAVTLAKADAQAVAIILTPYSTLVTGVVAYYFVRARR